MTEPQRSIAQRRWSGKYDVTVRCNISVAWVTAQSGSIRTLAALPMKAGFGPYHRNAGPCAQTIKG